MSRSPPSALVESGAAIGRAAPNQALSKIEATDLARCERVIREGLPTFRAVGEALAVIRDSRLYRTKYKTFAAYCDAAWGWTDRHARRLIVASKESKTGPTGPENPLSSQLLTKERYVRELKRLPNDDVRAEALAEAVKDGGGKVTLGVLKKAVEKRLPPDPDRIVDGRGDEVKPPHLKPVFTARDAFLSMRLDLNRMKARLRDMCGGPAGRVLAQHFKQCESDVKNLLGAVKFAAPYAECPRCHASKKVCLLCGDKTTGEDPCGWVTEIQWTVSSKGVDI